MCVVVQTGTKWKLDTPIIIMSILYSRREPKAARLASFDILLTASDLHCEEYDSTLFVFHFLTKQTHAFHTTFSGQPCVCIVSFSTGVN